MFAFIKIRAARFNNFSSRFQMIFVGFAGLFAFGSRFIWITRIPTRPDPDPTYPDWAPIPNTEQLLPVLSAAGQASLGKKRTIVTSLIQQVQRSPGYRSLRLGKKRTIIRFLQCPADPAPGSRTKKTPAGAGVFVSCWWICVILSPTC